MEMIGHDYVSADQPVRGTSPSFEDGAVSFGRREQWPTMPSADRQEYDNRAVARFEGGKVDRVFTLRNAHL